MPLLSLLDIVALVWFCAAWNAYAVIVERTAYGASSLNAQADRLRQAWMQQMLARDARIVDAQIMGSLQNGTAFFASTSLIALGGTLTILDPSVELRHLLADLPLGAPTTSQQWDVKVVGLAIVFAVAFFKFAWSYRLFNYAAIMLGAAPPSAEKETPQARDHAHRTAMLAEVAGRHFNRGQRTLFLALGYLGWFVGPWLFMIATAVVLGVLWWRQFASPARRAMTE